MNIVAIDEIKLIGLALNNKTTNTNGQSHIDCENLWHEFDKNKFITAIPNKQSDEIFGVYYNYEGDNTKPFGYFIGCKVSTYGTIPTGLESLTIPAGNYHKIIAKGKMPDCMINAWKELWATDIARSYQIDFEVYDERSKDWTSAEVDIYVSIK